MEGTSVERGSFSPAFLLYCMDAAPEIGSYFEQESFREIQGAFDAMMHDMYPNEVYQEHSYAASVRVMFTIDGIVVYQALEGDRVGHDRFRVCRCPLPALLGSMQPHSVKAWKSRARAPRQTVMEDCWQLGWSMYDWIILQQHDIRIELSDEDSDEE